MKRLLIVGAGGFGREVLAWALDIYTKRDGWEIGGFLDDNLSALRDLEPSYEIIDTPLNLRPNRMIILYAPLATLCKNCV